LIAKQISMRAARKSDFLSLVSYITDPQNKQERVGAVRVTHCRQEGPLDATLEVLAIQALNTRAVSDKTYHLLVSFPSGEAPADEVLQATEARLVESLGYAEHQRVSAIHHDTDHLHIHIAINKIHPLRHTLHEPYRAFRTLGEICGQLEAEYGLQRTNHAPLKVGSENRAADMERHSGIESLLGWLQRECVAELSAAHSWQELHESLGRRGLSLSLRGNGLVILDPTGLAVKASSVGREFSKGQLEARLGRYQSKADRSGAVDPTQVHVVPNASGTAESVARSAPQSSNTGSEPREGAAQVRGDGCYRAGPIFSIPWDSHALYAEYRAEVERLSTAKTTVIDLARREKERLIGAVQRKNRLKRTAIKMLSGAGVNKKLLYMLARQAYRAEIAKVKAGFLRKREIAFAHHRRLTWADWLQARASHGDLNALQALRAREAKSAASGNAIWGRDIRKHGPVPGMGADGVTKAGTVIYRIGDSAIHDDGETFTIARGANAAGVEAALRMAIRRHGHHIAVSGSTEFKNRVLRTALASRLTVTFDDASLEARRKEHDLAHPQSLPTSAAREHIDDQSTIRRAGRRTGSTGTCATSRDGSSAPRGATIIGQPARHRGSALTSKPNLGRIGTEPPPQRKNCLRGLSELGMVQFGQSASVLLPGHVPGHLEQQRAARADELRRGDASLAELAPTEVPMSAADAYVNGRNQKRSLGFDITNYRVYNSSDEGEGRFAGERRLGNELLALVEKRDAIVVVAIDSATSRRIQRLSIGEPVFLTADGRLRMKGRTR
jgi:hypothetical protein